MKTFTSIFHEEVIPMNEFKGEAEAHYSQRNHADKALGDHHTLHGSIKKNRDRYRDKGHSYGEGEPATNAEGAKKRIDRAKEVKNTYDKANKTMDDSRAKRKAQNESFLLDIDLD